MSTASAAWNDGVGAQIAFWVAVMRNYEGFEAQHAELRARLDPQRPLNAALVPHLPARPGLRILDVASGPVASVGWRGEAGAVQVTAIDPLAMLYADVLAEQELSPPVGTVQCDPEKMDVLFGPSFDVVYFDGGLTQCYDPMAALRASMAVVAPGGFAYVIGRAADGEFCKYYALHQWNVRVDARDALTLWRPEVEIDVAEGLQGLGTIEAVDRDGFLSVLIRKT